MIHALANIAFLVALTVAVGATLYTFGRHSEAILTALFGRFVR